MRSEEQFQTAQVQLGHGRPWGGTARAETNNNAQKIGIVGSKLVIRLDSKSVWRRDSLPVQHILSLIFALVTICILYTTSMRALSTVICCQCGMPMNQSNVGTVWYSNKYMPYHPRSKSPNLLQSINKNMSNIPKKSNFSTNKQKSSVRFPGSLTT